MSKKIQVTLFLLALMAMFATTAGAESVRLNRVRLTIEDETVSFNTAATTVAGFIESEGIYLNTKDIINLDLDEQLNLKGITELQIRRSFLINVVIDSGEPFEFEVGPAQRVGHVIAELREEHKSDFAHDGFLNDALEPGFILYLNTRIVLDQVLTVNVPFDREIRATAALPPGDMKILQEGVWGELSTVVQVVYVAGEEVGRTIISFMQTREPVREIILSGSNEFTGDALETANSNDLEPGTIMSVSGSINGHEYVLSKIVESTAYSARQPGLSNYTASGHRAVRGVIAVDPAYIPLGTWVYVEGYGRALASDTGSAIRGYKIDLCFDTVAEAMQHGRRNVRVWILNE